MILGKEPSRLQQYVEEDIGAMLPQNGAVKVGVDGDRLAELVNGDAAERRVVIYRILREDADVVGLLKDVHDGVDIVYERHDVQVARLGVYEALYGVTVAESTLREYQTVWQEVGEAQDVSLRQRMVLAHEGGKAVVHKRNGADELVRTGGHHGEHDVYLVVLQHTEQVGETLVVGVDLYLGVLCHEADHGFADVGLEAECESDVECAVQQAFQVEDAVAAFVHATQHLLGERQQLASTLCQHDAMRLPHKELCAEFFLKGLDLL